MLAGLTTSDHLDTQMSQPMGYQWTSMAQFSTARHRRPTDQFDILFLVFIILFSPARCVK
jgi:hypothetical protein